MNLRHSHRSQPRSIPVSSIAVPSIPVPSIITVLIILLQLTLNSLLLSPKLRIPPLYHIVYMQKLVKSKFLILGNYPSLQVQ